MNAAQIISNAKSYATLRQLQMMNRLAAEAHAKAMAERDGCEYFNTNAEAQAQHREQEFEAAVRLQADVWGMQFFELLALAMGTHTILRP